MLPLITRHRPTTFKGMLCNEEIFAALQRALKDERRPHSFLMTGPSGVGKTTIARVIGNAGSRAVAKVAALFLAGIAVMMIRSGITSMLTK